MARPLLKIPDDLAFQRTYNGIRGLWRCEEFTCERYPALQIRVHRRSATPEIVQYMVIGSNGDGDRFQTLRSAYTELMSRPRRVIHDKNIKRRYADGYSARRKAALDVLAKTGGRITRSRR